MSWHYLQGQEEASSEAISWDGAAFAPSKSKTTLGEYCLPGNGTDSSRGSPSGMTLRRLTGTPGAAGLMWYRGDSPVRTYLPPEGEQVSEAENDRDCGPRWPESLARYSPATYSWKTAQCSLLGGLISFSETWPRWGMMRDGESSPLLMLEHRTSEKGYGYLPTPVKNEGPGKMCQKLTDAIAILEGCCPRYQPQDNPGKPKFLGKVSCRFAEWMMGWPVGWTNSQPLAMDKFRQWWRLHSEPLADGAANEYSAVHSS